MGRRFLRGAFWRVFLGVVVTWLAFANRAGEEGGVNGSDLPRGRTERLIVLEAIVFGRPMRGWQNGSWVSGGREGGDGLVGVHRR